MDRLAHLVVASVLGLFCCSGTLAQSEVRIDINEINADAGVTVKMTIPLNVNGQPGHEQTDFV